MGLLTYTVELLIIIVRIIFDRLSQKLVQPPQEVNQQVKFVRESKGRITIQGSIF